MYQNLERAGEESGQTCYQGHMCFSIHYSYVAWTGCFDVNANTFHPASVSKFTLSQAVPHLVQLFLNPDEVQNRAPTSRLLADLVNAAQKAAAIGTEPDVPPLSPFKDEVLGVFTVGIKNTGSCVHALNGLKGMVLTPGLLTDEELGFIVHNVNEILSSDENQENEDIR